jgi:tRNA A-37 threonylcarbamoyl transferase component Bud32/predicted nucleotidyltransferase
MSSSELANRAVPNPLSGEVRAALTRVAEGLAEGRRLVALAAYGSYVAGYARPGSDYDLLVVLEDYRPKVRYRYLEAEGLEVSALLVDAEVLERDAESATLGEFVAGRLLNIYEALAGGDYLTRVELKLKRRVVLEELRDVAASYGDFAPFLIIPLAYFLFDKLKKRAFIYPPALYSYTKTYDGPQATANLDFTLQGFRAAIESIAADGLVEFLPRDRVKLRPDAFEKGRLAKLEAIMTTARRGITQYAVHGYAGRVRLEVVGREALAKLTRSREVTHVPEVLSRPKSLWEIEEGVLVMEADGWLKATAHILGLEEPVKSERSRVGEFYNAANIYTLSDGRREVKVVVKRYRDPRSVKWALISLALPSFASDPLSRLAREYGAIRRLRPLGFNTPEVVALLLDDRVMVTRYIEGTLLAQFVEDYLAGRQEELGPIIRFGETLGRLHQHGYTMGDTKASNAIFREGEIYLTDLEQATEGGEPGWDLAEFLYYSTKLTIDVERAKSLARAFVEGYLRTGKAEAVKAALSLKYSAIFQPFMTPQVARAIRQTLSRMA